MRYVTGAWEVCPDAGLESDVWALVVPLKLRAGVSFCAHQISLGACDCEQGY
jgi:hypothetical protein